jgi:transcriptional regulator with XRE-family HTH domain
MSKSLTDQIREAVKQSGLTQHRICRQTGIDPASMSNFVSGKRGISLAHLDTLAAFLGLQITTTKRKDNSKS